MMRLGERLRQERLRRHLSQEALAEALGISPKSISRWEQGQAVPQSYHRLRLSRFFGLEPGELLETELPSSPPWTVPFPRHPYFTGREEILESLHTRLTTWQPLALTQASALSGLGGIGKTQVAIEYAYRYSSEYSAVFWVAAETAESLMSSLQQIANHLRLPEREAAEQAQMVSAVHNWLARQPGWLLIADNVEEIDGLQAVLPALRQGALLLTTRRQSLGPLAEPLELPPMKREEGITLLLHRARLLNIAEKEDALLQEMLDTSLALAAGELVTLLEGLPLALDQAGAYIEETGCSVSDYFQRYSSQHQRLLARRGTHAGAHPDSVAATLSISVERIQGQHPAAVELLRLCALLHPEALPEEVLVAGAPHLGPMLGPAVSDPYQFDLLLAALRSASLVSRSPETGTISLHRLVQVVLQDQMEPAEKELWSQRAVRTVNAAFPEPEFDAWPQCERCLAHALACIPLTKQADSNLSEAGELLYKAGSYLLARGRFGEAELPLVRAGELAERQYGAEHPALIPRLEKRAELLWRQGKYGLTEPLLQRVLALEERHLEAEHPQTAETLNNLGLLYCNMGEYEQAEPLLLRALAIREQQLGAEHPKTAETLNNLSLLYWSQGKYEPVEKLLLRSLHIQERLLGPEHPETSLILINLATLYRDRGKYEQGEQLYRRALHIREQKLGATHPDTALTLIGLASLYQKQGKKAEAEPLYQRALQIQEQQLGPNHPGLARTLNYLATLYREQEKYEQAETLYQRALQIREQRLGPEHPETATTLNELAILYREQGKYEQARPLYQQALAICEQRMGPEHPQTLKIRDEYNRLLKKRGSSEE